MWEEQWTQMPYPICFEVIDISHLYPMQQWVPMFVIGTFISSFLTQVQLCMENVHVCVCVYMHVYVHVYAHVAVESLLSHTC